MCNVRVNFPSMKFQVIFKYAHYKLSVQNVENHTGSLSKVEKQNKTKSTTKKTVVMQHVNGSPAYQTHQNKQMAQYCNVEISHCV